VELPSFVCQLTRETVPKEDLINTGQTKIIIHDFHHHYHHHDFMFSKIF